MSSNEDSSGSRSNIFNTSSFAVGIVILPFEIINPLQKWTHESINDFTANPLLTACFNFLQRLSASLADFGITRILTDALGIVPTAHAFLAQRLFNVHLEAGNFRLL